MQWGDGPVTDNANGTSALNELRREWIAIVICALSGALGAAALVMRWGSVSSDLISTGAVWTFTADWLGRRLGLLRLRPGQIYALARQGRLRPSGLARVIRDAGVLLMLAGAVYFFAH